MIELFQIAVLSILVLIVLYLSFSQDIESYANDVSVFKKVVNSSCNGILRGAVIGYLTSGPEGAVSGSVLYGLANPILTYTQHNYLSDETL